jgi:predicted metal-dependent phosphoesterase TrpH
MKADLHVHSIYSEHSTATLDDIVQRSLDEGLDCVAVTDHRTIEGAKELKKIASFEVIIGQEVMTKHGEITGLFLRHTLEPHMSLIDTISAIKAQGGLVYVPHPFERVRFKRSLKIETLTNLLHDVDIIETFNSRTTLQRFNTKAEAFADRYGCLKAAGSDAHSAVEIGRAFVVMPDFRTSAEFLQALQDGTVHGERSGLRVHVKTMAVKLWLRARKLSDRS